MQVEPQESFAKRTLYYTANAYVHQLKKGENYNRLKKVYFIGILNFVLLNYLSLKKEKTN